MWVCCLAVNYQCHVDHPLINQVDVFFVYLGKNQAKQEDLKEMGDISSGMSSSIMQIYLKQVLESFFHSQSTVRHFALSVITLTLSQGLIHPVQVRSQSHYPRHGHYLLQARSVWDCPLCCFECITSCSQTRKNVCFFCFFLVCALLDRHGNRPRANHEEQGRSTAGRDWQEIFRLHPCEQVSWFMISVCKWDCLI